MGTFTEELSFGNYKVGIWDEPPSFRTILLDYFSPANYFLAGEEGVWYDPSDFSTLFQDSAGTTPVTAVGQSVGLVLDKRLGLVPGAELVTNGDFTGGTTTGWTGNSATLSVVSGAMNVTNTAGFGNASQTVSTVAGKWYKAEVTLGGSSALLSAVGTTSLSLSGSGAKSGVFLASGSTILRLYCNEGTIGAAATFDNVTLKEIPGNHAYQATAGSRPILARTPFGGRRNLLTYTEALGTAPWSNSTSGTGVASTVSADAGTDPVGALTADRIQFDLGGGTTSSDFTRRIQGYTAPATTHVYSIYIRSFDGVSSYNMHLVDPSGSTRGIVVTGAWQRFEVTATATGVNVNYAIGIRGGLAPTNSNTADVLVWGAQLETGATATAYQKVVSTYDVTETGKADCYCLNYDGTDDFLVTGSIDFSATDEMTVIAGARKASDAAIGMVVDCGNLGVGAFAIQAPPAAANQYQFYSGGSLGTNATASGYAAPETNVVSGLGEVSSDTCVLRVNGTQVATSATDQGTGNYSNTAIYIGRRAGTSRAFNGNLYQLIVRGKTTAGTDLTNGEDFVNDKTGAY